VEFLSVGKKKDVSTRLSTLFFHLVLCVILMDPEYGSARINIAKVYIYKTASIFFILD